jgi:hypothetical protein
MRGLLSAVALALPCRVSQDISVHRSRIPILAAYPVHCLVQARISGRTVYDLESISIVKRPSIAHARNDEPRHRPSVVARRPRVAPKELSDSLRFDWSQLRSCTKARPAHSVTNQRCTRGLPYDRKRRCGNSGSYTQADRHLHVRYQRRRILVNRLLPLDDRD